MDSREVGEGLNAEKDALTYIREDMARAFDEGVWAMSRALQGGVEPVNTYRVTSPAECSCAMTEGSQRRCPLHGEDAYVTPPGDPS